MLEARATRTRARFDVASVSFSSGRPAVMISEDAVHSAVGDATLPEQVTRELRCSMPDAIPLLLQVELKVLIQNSGERFRRRVPER